MEAIRNVICIPPPALLPPVATTQTYWCIGRVCASADIIINTAPQKESTFVVPEYLEVPPPILVSLLLLSLIMILLAFRSRFHDAASSCVSACISMCSLISASALSASRTLQRYHHSGYRNIEDFVRRCYQSIRDLAYELHPPIISAASSEDDCASPNTDTDKADLESQRSPILDTSSSAANDSNVLSEDAKEENLDNDHSGSASQPDTNIHAIETDQGSSRTTSGPSTFSPNSDEANPAGVRESSNLGAKKQNLPSDQSPVMDDIDHFGFASRPRTTIPEIETDQGSSRTKSGSSTFSPNSDEANPTDAPESSNLDTIANEDNPSSPHESSLHDYKDEDPTSKSYTSTPNTTTKDADPAPEIPAPEPTSNPNPSPQSPHDSESSTSSPHSPILTPFHNPYAPLLDLPNSPDSDTDQDWDEATAIAIQQRCERAKEMIAKGEIPSRRDQKALRKSERVVGRGFRGS